MKDSFKRIRRNGGIRAQQVRLINAEGEQVGVVSLFEAMTQADAAGFDLVEISPNVNPPVCKIMDFGKYCYSLEKKEKDNKKKQKVVDVKEVKFRPKIQEHDYQTKLRQCEKFLKRGDRVKVAMWFRGREKAHIDVGQQILQRLVEDLQDIGKVEKNFGLSGSSIIILIVPAQA